MNAEIRSGVRAAFSPRRLVACAGLILSLGILLATTRTLAATDDDRAIARRIIVAIVEKPDPVMVSGSSPHGYAGLQSYAGSERTRATAARLARDHDLTEISAWTIEPLKLRCMLYEIPATADRASVLADLRKDRRVHLAQELQEFSTLSASSTEPAPGAAAARPEFNDPYAALQTGFSAIDAGGAQRWASGSHVPVALIDTGVDTMHPDLAERIVEQRDFVGSDVRDPGRDRHGTEVAGVIAAVANNGLGIVGVAPAVELFSYRACWPNGDGTGRARCNSFTLAQALAAAIRSPARVINLSLGGPHDALLGELLEHAVARGTIVVGAVAPDAGIPGFPVSTKGVIAVDSSGAPGSSDLAALHAPGEEILTLEPGGHYDYASGSSLAAAHVTGAIALLLQVSPRLDASRIVSLLRNSARHEDGAIDACIAVSAASGHQGTCSPD